MPLRRHSQQYPGHASHSQGKVKGRSRIRGFILPKCLKLDETAAIERGIVPFEFKTSYDYNASSDGFLCISVRAKKAIEMGGFDGFEYHKVKTLDGRNIYLAVCNVFVSMKKSQFRFDSKCPSCKRWRWTGGLSRVSAIDFPKNPRTIFMADLPLESGFGRQSLPYASEVFVKYMHDNKMTGFGGVLLEK